jgi:NADPH:quinone reductase
VTTARTGQPPSAGLPMRMVQASHAGGPEVLAVQRVEQPTIGADEVLVAVRLAGINFAEVNTRRGTYVRRGGSYGLGRDVLGEVARVGARVRGLRPGQRVAGFSASPAYADYARADQSLLWPVPDAISDEQAAALPTVGQTAYHLLTTAGRMGSGESVLITASAGGVGSVAVQLASLLGAGHVVAAAGSAERARGALLWGADEAVAYHELSHPPNLAHPMDLALDGVGGSVRRAVLDHISSFGRLVHFGNSSGEPEELPAPRQQRERGLGLIGFHLESLRRDGPSVLARSAELLFAWIADGELTIPVHEVLPLDRAADAHRLLESRRVRGKLLLSTCGANTQVLSTARQENGHGA